MMVKHPISVLPPPSGATIVTRFAPSPTGRLHLGHAFSAIQGHDFARASAGRFLLRIEDIDGTRSREEHVAGILQDLAWLGLSWDDTVLRQSTRLATYDAALDRLRAKALVYPCFCTRADIAASLSAPHGPGGARYPGTCRGIDVPDLSRPHCWRLDMAKALQAFRSIDQHNGDDLVWRDHGIAIVADPAAQGDVVLARKDAPASYHLAVTVDDAAQGITHVVRGADLFDSTHVHRLLQALLGLPTPEYRHHPLLTDKDGRRLAKRDGAPSLADLRRDGMAGDELAAMLRGHRVPIGFELPNA